MDDEPRRPHPRPRAAEAEAQQVALQLVRAHHGVILAGQRPRPDRHHPRPPRPTTDDLAGDIGRALAALRADVVAERARAGVAHEAIGRIAAAAGRPGAPARWNVEDLVEWAASRRPAARGDVDQVAEGVEVRATMGGHEWVGRERCVF